MGKLLVLKAVKWKKGHISLSWMYWTFLCLNGKYINIFSGRKYRRANPVLQTNHELSLSMKSLSQWLNLMCPWTQHLCDPFNRRRQWSFLSLGTSSLHTTPLYGFFRHDCHFCFISIRSQAKSPSVLRHLTQSGWKVTVNALGPLEPLWCDVMEESGGLHAARSCNVQLRAN